MLTPEQAIERSSWLVQEGLKGALLSETEVCVDARNAIASLTAYLCGPSEPGSVTLMRGHAVRAVEPPKVVLASGDTIQANRVCVCTGEDLRTLFPEAYHESGLRLCKLQMMRTVPQPGGVRMGPMLAAGSTLRHYPAFEHCPSLERVRARFSAERPHFDRFGLHVMASQTPAGEITLGDSHEYGEPISPFNRDDIDDWILEYLRTFLCLPDPRIAERWFGVYAKPKAGEHEFVASPYPSVRVISGVGGAGMTMSFGLVEDVFKAWCE
jgi:FAD dependent oxidoreductase TIGR03364